MRNPRRLFLMFLVTLFSVSLIQAAEKSKAPDLTLEDVIFDPSYLKKFLGANTLVVPDGKDKTLPSEAVAAIKKATLDEKSKFFVLPDGVARPELVSSISSNFPPPHQSSTKENTANFFAYVDTDGTVKCMYCYQKNDEVYAIASGKALLGWRFSPTKLQGKAVPVLVVVNMSSSNSAVDSNYQRWRAMRAAISPLRDQLQSSRTMSPNPPPPQPK